MKVLFSCHVPFGFAHGGLAIQIEQTMRALPQAGVEVEPLRWWDAEQRADLFHHFGRISPDLGRLVRSKGIRVIVSDLLTEQGSRSPARLAFQRTIMRTLRALAPERIPSLFLWEGFRSADACVALTPWEAHLMRYLFDAPEERLHVVPNGVEDVFLKSASRPRGPWLVCTATITERKRVLELAEAAVLARTPLWVIGRPYTAADPYAQRFIELARRHGDFVRYEGAITDRARMAEIYREARGFVLLSAMESLSLSALEAAACECALLLSDLPWAKTVFPRGAAFCRLDAGPPGTAEALRTFYDAAPGLPHPEKPLSWLQVAHQLKSIYERVLESR